MKATKDYPYRCGHCRDYFKIDDVGVVGIEYGGNWCFACLDQRRKEVKDYESLRLWRKLFTPRPKDFG